jgi:hypothetical protein
MAFVTEYKLEELLLIEEQEYIKASWEKELERREKKIWITVNYDNVLRAINEYLLTHDHGNLVEKFRTKHRYMQKHLNRIVLRVIDFCRKHKLKKAPKPLIEELIKYEIERKIIMRNYARNYKIPYKYPK